MSRIDTWPSRLNDTIEAARALPFAWGQNDCCVFVARCIDAMTGSEHTARCEGKYDTEAGAAEIIEGFGGLEAEISRLFSSVPVKFACRGDVVLLDLPGKPLGIVDLSGVRAAVVGETGLKFIKRERWLLAWRV